MVSRTLLSLALTATVTLSLALTLTLSQASALTVAAEDAVRSSFLRHAADDSADEPRETQSVDLSALLDMFLSSPVLQSSISQCMDAPEFAGVFNVVDCVQASFLGAGGDTGALKLRVSKLFLEMQTSVNWASLDSTTGMTWLANLGASLDLSLGDLDLVSPGSSAAIAEFDWTSVQGDIEALIEALTPRLQALMDVERTELDTLLSTLMALNGDFSSGLFSFDALGIDINLLTQQVAALADAVTEQITLFEWPAFSPSMNRLISEVVCPFIWGIPGITCLKNMDVASWSRAVDTIASGLYSPRRPAACNPLATIVHSALVLVPTFSWPAELKTFESRPIIKSLFGGVNALFGKLEELCAAASSAADPTQPPDSIWNPGRADDENSASSTNMVGFSSASRPWIGCAILLPMAALVLA